MKLKKIKYDLWLLLQSLVNIADHMDNLNRILRNKPIFFVCLLLVFEAITFFHVDFIN